MLGDAQRRWCTTQKELLAVIPALTRWRHFLIGGKVIVRTDHNCLRYLMQGKSLTDEFARYLDFVADFNLQIDWVPGRDNKITDMLSRPCEPDPKRRYNQCRTKQARAEGSAVEETSEPRSAEPTGDPLRHQASPSASAREGGSVSNDAARERRVLEVAPPSASDRTTVPTSALMSSPSDARRVVTRAQNRATGTGGEKEVFTGD